MHSKHASFLPTVAAVCLFLPAAGRSQAIPAYTITTVAGTGTPGYSSDGV